MCCHSATPRSTLALVWLADRRCPGGLSRESSTTASVGPRACTGTGLRHYSGTTAVLHACGYRERRTGRRVPRATAEGVRRGRERDRPECRDEPPILSPGWVLDRDYRAGILVPAAPALSATRLSTTGVSNADRPAAVDGAPSCTDATGCALVVADRRLSAIVQPRLRLPRGPLRGGVQSEVRCGSSTAPLIALAGSARRLSAPGS